MANWHNLGHKQHYGPAKAYDHGPENRGAGNGFDVNTSESPRAFYDDFMNRAMGFMGVPRGAMSNAQSNYEHAFDTYPEHISDAFVNFGFAGKQGHEVKNVHLAQVLLEKTTSHQCYPLTRMSPWMAHNSSLKIQVNQVRFHQHVLDKLPELAMPRLVTHNASQGWTSMGRWGIACIFEATFLQTEQGRRTYTLVIEQMKIATVTTANTLILVTLLTTPPFKQPGVEGVMDTESSTSANGIDLMFQRELQMTAMMNKPGGTERLISLSRNTLMARGVGKGNFMVIPGGSEITMSRDSLSHEYLLGADDSDENIAKSKSMSETIIPSCPRAQGHGTPDWDPFKRQRAYGSHFVLGMHRLEGEKVEDYSGRKMNEIVYDMDSGNFRTMSYSELYRYCGVYRFNEPGAKLNCTPASIGYGFINDLRVYTWGQAYRKFLPPRWLAAIVPLIRKRCEANPQARHKFLNSLSLLPKDDVQVKIKGSYPDDREWDMQIMYRTAMRGTEFDEPPDVNDYRAAMQGRRIAGGGSKIEVVRHTLRKRARQQQELTGKDLFDANANYALPASNPMGDEYHSHDGLIVKSSNLVRESRVVRRRYAMPQGDEKEDVLLAETNAIEAMKTALTVDANTKVVTDHWIDAIETAYGKTNTEKLVALQTLQTCVEACEAWLNDGYVKNLLGGQPSFATVQRARRAVVDVCMEKILSASDLEAALRVANQNPNLQTTIEKECIRDNGVVQIPSTAALEQGAWRADGSLNDGQVFVMGRFNSRSSRKTLPVDAFAATLATIGKAVFLTTEDDAAPLSVSLAQPMGTSFRKDRAIALQWSIVISHVFQAFRNLNEIKDQSLKDNAISAAELDKLVELSRQLLMNVDDKQLVNICNYGEDHLKTMDLPLSQAYLKPVMKDLCNLVIKLIRRQQAYNEELSDDGNQATLATEEAKLTTATANVNSAKTALDAAAPADRPAREAALNTALGRQATADRNVNNLHLGWWGVVPQALETVIRNVANFARNMLLGGLETDVASLTLERIDVMVDAYRKANKQEPASEISKLAPQTASWSWSDKGIWELLDRASMANGGLWNWSDEYDVPMAFAMRVARPCQKFTMGSAMRMVAGGTDGASNTFFQMPNFMMGVDPGPKIVYGNYSVYFSPVVRRPEKLVVFPDVFVCGYHGGGGVTINDPNSEASKAAWAAGRGASMFVLAIPMNEINKLPHSWMSITGRLPSHIPCDPEVAEAMLYPGCDAVARCWGFTNVPNRADHLKYKQRTNPRELRQNVMCFQDLQVGWSTNRQNFSNYTLNTDGFGQSSRDQDAKHVFAGSRPVFSERPSYWQASSNMD
jgi:hypothetical protein